MTALRILSGLGSPLKKISLLIALMALAAAIGGFGWRRLHPPSTPLETKVRAVLLAADRIDVGMETIEIPVGSKRTIIKRLSPDELAPVVGNLKLTREQAFNWGTGYVPEIYFLFYKNGQVQAEITVSYSPLSFNFFFSNRPQFSAWISRGLDPTTIQALKELVARHPELVRALATEQGLHPYLNERWRKTDRSFRSASAA